MFPEVLNLFIPMLVLLYWVKLCRDRSGIYYDPYIPLWKQPDHRLASQKHEARYSIAANMILMRNSSYLFPCPHRATSKQADQSQRG